jgi:SET domain-containing protein
MGECWSTLCFGVIGGVIGGADARRHDAQPCYCGEPNCVGSIGGKTQTDVGTMNDLFLDGMTIRSAR